MKKIFRLIKKIIRVIATSLENAYANVCKYIAPKVYADILYRRECEIVGGVNWNSPQDLNQKIIWLSFNSNTTQWSRLADKYEVRKYITEKGLSDLLVPLYGVWDSVDELSWSDLPMKCIIKLNNGSGDAVVIKNKDEVSEQQVKIHLKECLKENLGIESAEPHYCRIKPKVIAEKLLEPMDGNLVDYKIWCFDGIPFGVFTASNRDIKNKKANFNVYDLQWNKHNEWLTEEYRNDVNVRKPIHFQEMLEYATRLSCGFPQVRVDFYEVDGKVYFGEMTFTSMGGRMRYFTPEVLRKMGNMFSVK